MAAHIVRSRADLTFATPPEFEGRSAVLTVTYVIVVFSIVVQGLPVGPLIRRVVVPLVADEPRDPEIDAA